MVSGSCGLTSPDRTDDDDEDDDERLGPQQQQQQQQRVRWVWPRSEICGRSFKGRREQREGRKKKKKKKVQQDMSQTSVSSHKQ